jgi:hypothetical protein
MHDAPTSLRPRLGFTAFLTALSVLTACATATAQDASPLLPDLDQATPRRMQLRQVISPKRGRLFMLGFDSAAANVGDGPMLLHGVRLKGREPLMRADQLVRTNSGRLQLTKNVGRLRYIRFSDHQHWHFLDFMRYEIRDDRTLRLVLRDQKTGFCLGDRYRAPKGFRIPARVNRPQYGDNCALGKPGLLGIFEGLTPGWGDLYKASLEGQEIDITSLPAGTYQLVHRANPTGRLIEKTLANNSSSLRIRVRWPHGHSSYPTVTIIGACPGTLGCVGSWLPGPAPIPPDLVGTPYGNALPGGAPSATP